MQHIHVLDFDGSIHAQTELLSTFKSQIKINDLRRFYYWARLWTSPKKFTSICAAAVKHIQQPCFTLIGSGDFHHFSYGLIANLVSNQAKPITVVLFDNHPDWIKPPHQFHCGTWVYSLARLPQVQRIIIVGLESGDIDGVGFKNGDVENYLSKKVILLPYQPVQITLPENQHSNLCSQLAKDLTQGIDEIIGYIETEQVYISIDKDCLRVEDAFTNWEQGTLPLSTVTGAIKVIRSRFNILGADTVGDYSPPKFRSPLKMLGSWLDRKIKTPKSNQINSAMLKRNELANIALIQALMPELSVSRV